MPRRRPVLRNAGAVVFLVGIAVLVAGCSDGAVTVDPVDVASSDTAACAELRDRLPEVVAGLERRSVEPKDAYAAAWGSSPIVLRCGVDEPEEFDRYSACQITNGVAWFIPDDQITGEPVDVVMTTIGRSPGVEVTLPAEHFPPADAMVDLAPAIKETTEQVARCG